MPAHAANYFTHSSILPPERGVIQWCVYGLIFMGFQDFSQS